MKNLKIINNKSNLKITIMKRKLLITTTMVLFFGMGLITNAQQEPSTEELSELSLEDLMNMEITSVSKKAEKLQNVPSSIYVITAEDIERTSSQNLMQLLRDVVPGMWGVANDYRNNDVFVRNTYEGSVLYLLDGTPLLDITSYNLDFESFDIPLKQIERIEIIKGSGGTIYGANSASGVVSIITKDPDKQKKLIAETDYAMPGKYELNIIGTPLQSEKLSATFYGKYSTFSGFEQMAVTEDATSVVPATFSEGTTTITNRFTGDDNTFNSINGGFSAKYELTQNSRISAGLNVVNIQTDKYLQEFHREDGYFVLENGNPKPRSADHIFLRNQDKLRLTGNLRYDLNISEDHDLFLRFSNNSENRSYLLAGGYYANNAIYDFEVQDNIKLGFNQLSFGGNFRWLQYDMSFEDGASVTFIEPNANHHLLGLFVQDKISLLDEKLNFYIGAKGESFSLIDDKFYFSPMLKFVIHPMDQVTLIGGYSKSFTTPGYNTTNAELDLFKANSSALYPIYYPQVQQAIYDQAYQETLNQGADEATAAATAQAYVDSEEGQQVIDQNTNAQLDMEYPQGNVNVTTINGPETEPTSFTNYEIGVRYRPSESISFETNYYYTLVENSFINSPTDVDILESPTRPGQLIQAYYAGNYGKGYNTGLESVFKMKIISNLFLEFSHTWFTYDLEYKENKDFDINALTEQQLDLKDEKYPQLPEHILKSKI